MRYLLVILFTGILVAMLSISAVASLDRSVFNVGHDLLADRWFQATLCDAYCAFLTFFVWVAYKEQSFGRRAIWFVLIICLGSIAIAIYVLIGLARLNRGDPLAALLLRNGDGLRAYQSNC